MACWALPGLLCARPSINPLTTVVFYLMMQFVEGRISMVSAIYVPIKTDLDNKVFSPWSCRLCRGGCSYASMGSSS